MRGITEKTVFVYNPLPNVSEQDLIVAIGLDGLVEPSTRSPFALTWQWSGGLQKEVIILNPGDRQPMRESDALACMKELREQGAVVHDLNADEKTVKRLSIDACLVAIRFWNDRGQPRLLEQRQKHGYTTEDMESRRYEYRHYHLAAARKAAIEEHVKTLRAPKAAAK
jgi:hypothetical protein